MVRSPLVPTVIGLAIVFAPLPAVIVGVTCFGWSSQALIPLFPLAIGALVCARRAQIADHVYVLLLMLLVPATLAEAAPADAATTIVVWLAVASTLVRATPRLPSAIVVARRSGS